MQVEHHHTLAVDVDIDAGVVFGGTRDRIPAEHRIGPQGPGALALFVKVIAERFRERRRNALPRPRAVVLAAKIVFGAGLLQADDIGVDGFQDGDCLGNGFARVAPGAPHVECEKLEVGVRNRTRVHANDCDQYSDKL